MGTQDNVSQLVEGCYTWGTLVNTENYLCTQENFAKTKHFLIGKIYMEYTKVC